MFSRVKELRKLTQLEQLRRLGVPNRRRTIRKGSKRRGINIGYHECKQAILIPNEVYCGLWKESVSQSMCKSCPYFDREAVEYKLFRRR